MHRPTGIALSLLLLLTVVLRAPSARSKSVEPRIRSFEFSYDTVIPTAPQGAHKLRLWIPVPQSDDDQEISSLTIESPVRYALHRDPEYGNRYIYLEAAPRPGTLPLKLRMRFKVKRREHQVPTDRPESSNDAVKAESSQLARFLQPDRLVPTDGIIRELAREQTRGLSRPLDRARAIYNYVVSTMRYDKSGEGWGRGDAIFACNVRRGNCSDFHSLLIGMMRAQGLPARFEIGFPLPTDQHDGEIPGYHCWAQFYLDGVGWVPVDSSEAWKRPALREYFFGAHDENRVLFTRGRDIRFNPAQQAGPLNFFIYPYAELDGKPFEGTKSQFWFRDLKNPSR